MYDRVLLMATGSGICVFLSFLLQSCKANVCVVWIAKGIEQNFGHEIKEMMSRHPQDKVIVHDMGSMISLKMLSPPRFSNCRGISFETKPRNFDPFTVPDEQQQHHKQNHHDKTTLPRVVKRSSIASSDFPSSHLCDLDLDEEVEVVNVFLSRLEEGKFEGERDEEEQ
ncbi:hypothetical protein LINPERHAP1_LOCUS35006 [Linum perenne]